MLGGGGAGEVKGAMEGTGAGGGGLGGWRVAYQCPSCHMELLRASELEQGQGHPWTCAAKCGGAPRRAVSDVDLNYSFGVLGHQGMGLARWPLWGWMEFAIWSRASLGHPRTCAPKCAAKCRL